MDYSSPPSSLEQLEELLSRPTPQLIDVFHSLSGDVLIVGAGGKMGPSLSVMAKRASNLSGVARRIIAVSRFSDSAASTYLRQNGVEIISSDLLAPDSVDRLPDAENIIYMAGMKFGTLQHTELTWAMNTYLPGLIGKRYRKNRIIVFSTGNIYGLTPVSKGGSTEDDGPDPQGEYAMSALGRERIFAYFSRAYGTQQSVIRLNYACDLRYGVLVDIARKVLNRERVPLNMAWLNTIWQGDANAMALMSLACTSSPPLVLNITGTRTLRVSDIALTFGNLFDRPVHFEGDECSDALLSNSSKAAHLLGPPAMNEDTLISWVAHWTKNVGILLDKPTHFESRDGKF